MPTALLRSFSDTINLDSVTFDGETWNPQVWRMLSITGNNDGLGDIAYNIHYEIVGRIGGWRPEAVLSSGRPPHPGSPRRC